MRSRILAAVLGTSLSLTFIGGTAAAQLTVVGVSPARHALAAAHEATIAVDFDRAIDPASLPPATAQFLVFGTNSGPIPGAFALENGGSRVRFTPAQPFFAGETVSILLGEGLQALDSSFLRTQGWASEFRVASARAERVFEQVGAINVGTVPGVEPRIYGGQACDLNDDGWVDLAIVNEDTSDVRVLLNQQGAFVSVLTPVNGVGSTPSPNEAADFDGDGHIDLCTANTGGSDVTILFGNGDGTFAPAVSVFVGASPRELAVLDVDGDADLDIVSANVGLGNLSVVRNDGSGGFGPPTMFDGGGPLEWGLKQADMNNDGIYDLIVGTRGDSRVRVHLGNGDGTFTLQGNQLAGASPWMIVPGDLNGDGNMDVTVASDQGVGSVLLGDGNGNLAPAVTYFVGSFAVATDLGDLDGDGDLDWVLSAFGGAEWTAWVNDGSGAFSFDQDFPALEHPGCALVFDMDGDRDLDLALLDETGDTALIQENRFAGNSFCFGDGGTTPGCTNCPCANNAPGGSRGGCSNPSGTSAALIGLRVPSVADDSLRFEVRAASPSSFGILTSGNDRLPSNAANPCFGQDSGVISSALDGLRCVGASVLRHGSRASDAAGAIGATNSGWGPPNAPIGGLIAQNGFSAGQTRHFQCFYRVLAAQGCGTGQNTTNGVSVTFLP